MQKSTDFMDESTAVKEAEYVEAQAYYRDMAVSGGNEKSEAQPLQVNCAGYYYSQKSFRQQIRSGRNDYYLQFVTEGRLIVKTFREPQELLPGMFTLYRPHTSYGYDLMPGDSIGYCWIHFTGFHAGRLLSNLGIETDRIGCTDATEKRMHRICGDFQRLFSEFVNRRPGFDDICGAILTEILVELARGEARASAGPRRKLESVAWLHSHYMEDHRIADLAAMEHLSESRYRDVFRRHTGLSPGDYRTALRLQHACEQLTVTDNTITEIAQDCGYTDVLYFMRIFKVKKGITPGEYRERSRRDGED